MASKKETCYRLVQKSPKYADIILEQPLTDWTNSALVLCENLSPRGVSSELKSFPWEENEGTRFSSGKPSGYRPQLSLPFEYLFGTFRLLSMAKHFHTKPLAPIFSIFWHFEHKPCLFAIIPSWLLRVSAQTIVFAYACSLMVLSGSNKHKRKYIQHIHFSLFPHFHHKNIPTAINASLAANYMINQVHSCDLKRAGPMGARHQTARFVFRFLRYNFSNLLVVSAK